MLGNINPFDSDENNGDSEKTSKEYVPTEVIEAYRARNKQLIEEAIVEISKENCRLTEADIQARIKRVDVYLRLSQLKKEAPKRTSETTRQIPGRKDSAKVTPKQRKNTDESMASQLYQCMKRIEKEISEGNLWMLCEVWQEVYSGPEYRKRPEYQRRYKQRVRTKSIHILLVWRRERLARGEEIYVAKSDLAAYDVEWKSATERDLDDSIASAMQLSFESIHSIQANREISERIHSKLEWRQQQHKLNGAAHKLYGYEYDDDEGKRCIALVEGWRVRWIFRKAELGMSTRKIAKEMNSKGWRTREGNLWSRKTVTNILRNEVYTGITKQYRNTYIYEHTGEKKVRHLNPKREVIYYPENITPPLITTEQWQRVNMLLDAAMKRSTRNIQEVSEFSLHGFLKCAYCGAPLRLKRTRQAYVKSNGKQYLRSRQYRCENVTRIEKPCPGTSIVAHIVEKAGWEFIGQELENYLPNLRKALDLLIDEQMSVQEGEALDRMLLDVDMNIANLEASKKLVTDALTKEVIQQGIDRLKEERAAYEKDKKEIRPDRRIEDEKRKNLENLLSYAEQARKGWRTTDIEERRSYLTILEFEGIIARENDQELPRWDFRLGLKRFLNGNFTEQQPRWSCRCQS